MPAAKDPAPKPVPEFVASRSTERLIFFSDAVVAIAITLLAIDLPVPAGSMTSSPTSPGWTRVSASRTSAGC